MQRTLLCQELFMDILKVLGIMRTVAEDENVPFLVLKYDVKLEEILM